MKIVEYQAKIQDIFAELEVVKNDGGYRLSDTNVFKLSIGKRVLRTELTDKGIPVYSANVFEPIGNIDKKLIDSFENEYIIWGIDGDWMVNILPKKYEFYPTDHCGTLLVDEEVINPRYMAYLLEKEGNLKGFSRTFRASLDRIKSINIAVPNIELQNKKMEEVNKIEIEIEKLKKEQTDINFEIKNIVEKYIN